LSNAVSVRHHLLGWLLVPLAILLLIGVAADYATALRPAKAAYDQALMDAAIAIAKQVTPIDGAISVDLPPIAMKMLRADQYDKIYLAVVGSDGRLIAGDQGLPFPAGGSGIVASTFYDAEYSGSRVRVLAHPVVVDGSKALVLVGETTVKRTRLVEQILLGMFLPELLFSAAVIALVWFGVGRGLVPLQRLAAEISARSHRDLRPVPEHVVPVEVRSVVQAVNELLLRLEASLMTQKHFLTDAAHQLRTPLAGLQSRLELGLSQVTPDEWQETLTALKGATDRTARLANQLLTLARAEAGGHLLGTRQQVDLSKLAQDIGEDWLHRALSRDLDFGFELMEVQVAGDPLLLRELLSNLVDNAVEYTTTGGKVTIRCAPLDLHAALEVEDEGPGIPDCERSRVFDRFYRLEGTPGRGSGLGLAIVREIATAHGGSVEIETPASGRGVLVRVRLPLA
jgi:two-component system sensor histidine kinase TctE